MKKLGFGLIILSCVLFILIPVVPFTSLTIAWKGMISTGLFVAGEITWWTGVVLVGKQVVEKYKKYLDPRKWFSKKKETAEKPSEAPDSGDNAV